jgi:hypothetical protein
LESRERSQLFDTAEADSVSFSKSAVDGSSFGDSHFGAADKGRDIEGIGIPVTDETLRSRFPIDGRFENPAARIGITKPRIWLDDY